MIIQSIDFKREKGSAVEKGLLIETYDEVERKNNFIIIDSMSKPVIEQVWEYDCNLDLIVSYK